MFKKKNAVWRLLCYGAVSLMYATVKMAHGSNQQRLIQYIVTICHWSRSADLICHWSRQPPPSMMNDLLLVKFGAYSASSFTNNVAYLKYPVFQRRPQGSFLIICLK